MLISGSIGIIILKKHKKIIYLLSDDHSNKVYCSNNGSEHKDIDDFLKNELDEGSQILLEEVPRDGFNLQELWPDSPHTQSLKDLFLNTENINGVDIRPYLIQFSWDILDVEKANSPLGNVKISFYLNHINNFFECRGKFYNTIFKPAYDSIKIKNSGLGKHLRDIRDRYRELKEEIKDDKELINYYENKKSVLYKIDRICDMIMEFYTLLLAFTTEKKSYIHAGLFHSNNILHYLVGEYNFEVKYSHGTITFPPPNKKVNSCILLPNEEKIGIF